jgi:hypothetical protein
MDFFDDGGDWQWLDDIGTGIGDFFGGSSTPNYGQGNDLLQPTQPRPIGPLTEQGNFSGDYGIFQGAGNLLSGASNFYNRNQNWIDPAVGAAGAYYKADRASDAADKYMRDQQPSIDFANKASARQQAYYDPANVEAGVGADLDRKAGMLTSQYRQQDQPRFANALAAGKLGSSDFGRKMAQRDAARDTNWANTVVPAAYDQYYNRGTSMSNADTATSRMLSGNPVLQSEYRDIRAKQDPWQNALLNYLG